MFFKRKIGPGNEPPKVPKTPMKHGVHGWMPLNSLPPAPPSQFPEPKHTPPTPPVQPPKEEIRFIGDLQRLKLEQGDVFILTVPGTINAKSAEIIKNRLEEQVPGHKFLVFSDGIKLGAVAAHEEKPWPQCNPWAEAIDEALIANGLDCTVVTDDPEDKLRQLISIEVQMALDPAVSNTVIDSDEVLAIFDDAVENAKAMYLGGGGDDIAALRRIAELRYQIESRAFVIDDKERQRREMCQKHHAALQKIAGRLGLSAGSDTHRDIIPAIENLMSMIPTMPNFDFVKDKMMGELTPEQQDDAHELWLRENLGWMGAYHEENYKKLLARLDLARGAMVRCEACDATGKIEKEYGAGLKTTMNCLNCNGKRIVPKKEAASETVPLPMWSIWIEGYRINGDSGEAQYVGFQSAETFEEAVREFYKHYPDINFDEKNLTHWGCRFFDNEEDARRLCG